jgi:hypothetical protein
MQIQRYCALPNCTRFTARYSFGMSGKAAVMAKSAAWLGVAAVAASFAGLFLPFARVACSVCFLAIFVRPSSGSLLGSQDGTTLLSLASASVIAWGLVVMRRWRQPAAAVSLFLFLAILVVVGVDASHAWSRVVGWNTDLNPVALEVGFYVSVVGAGVASACAGVVLIAGGGAGRMGWVAAGGGVGVLSLSPAIDPLGWALAAIGLALVILWRFHTPAPGLVLVGAGAGASAMLAWFYSSYWPYPFADPYQWTYAVAIPLCLAGVAIGLAWAILRREGSGVPRRRRPHAPA